MLCTRRPYIIWRRARTCESFEEPKNRSPASRACTTTLFDVPGRQATWAREIDSLESVPGLLKRLQIRAQKRSQGWLNGRKIVRSDFKRPMKMLFRLHGVISNMQKVLIKYEFSQKYYWKKSRFFFCFTWSRGDVVSGYYEHISWKNVQYDNVVCQQRFRSTGFLWSVAK